MHDVLRSYLQSLIPLADATETTGSGKEKRSTYNQFLSTLIKIIGEESSTDEVHSAAYQAFYIISTPGKSDLAKKYEREEQQEGEKLGQEAEMKRRN